ncbi:MAG: class I SAM-dependent methyltransferase [Akkermansiaceae bacterium]|nr:class I SAM-dependent methyltransferase [Akkermansiaceae bacterium]
MEKRLPLIHRVYGAIFKIWRVKRFRLFVSKIRPKKTDRVLDIGGYPNTWIAQPPVVHSIDSLNVHPVDWDPSQAPEHRINIVTGDGCALEMDDKSYDIAFSNSVIEHVGEWDRQVAFAKEVRRVGKALWIQTPAKECPVEPHYLALFVHWLPKSVQRRVLRHFTLWGWIARPSRTQIDEMVDTTRLLSKKEMKTLFPDCEIHTERLLGIIPKSYVAFRISGE